MAEDRSEALISENPKIVEEDRDTSGCDRTMPSGNPRIQRYLVAVEYIGTRFYGAQQQPTSRTVVGVLEVTIISFYFILFLITISFGFITNWIY